MPAESLECKKCNKEYVLSEEDLPVSEHEKKPTAESSSTFTCTFCKRRKSSKSPKWICPQCDSKLCTDCRPASRRTLLTPYAQCPTPEEQHGLAYYREQDESEMAEYTCDICNSKKGSNEAMWLCEEKNYLLCENCRPGPDGYVKCKKNHAMDWEADYYAPNDYYTCAGCKKQGRNRDGRWKCKLCPIEKSKPKAESGEEQKSIEIGKDQTFELCPECVPPLGMFSMVAVGETAKKAAEKIECEKGHPLIWSQMPKEIGEKESYSCKICKKSKEYRFGRYEVSLFKKILIVYLII